MNCNRCGTPIPEGAKFCGKCGNPANQPAPVEPPVVEPPVIPAEVPVEPTPIASPVVEPIPPVEAPAPAKKKTNWWIPVIAAIVAAAVAFGTCYFLFSGSSDKEEEKKEQAATQNASAMQEMLDAYEKFYKNDVSVVDRIFPSAALQRMSVDPVAVKSDPRYAVAIQSRFLQIAAIFGTEITFEFEYTSDAEVPEVEYAEIQTRLATRYGLTIEDARLVTFTITVMGDATTNSSTETENEYAVKANGIWYLLGGDGEFYMTDWFEDICQDVERSESSTLNDATLDWSDGSAENDAELDWSGEEETPPMNDGELAW